MSLEISITAGLAAAMGLATSSLMLLRSMVKMRKDLYFKKEPAFLTHRVSKIPKRQLTFQFKTKNGEVFIVKVNPDDISSIERFISKVSNNEKVLDRQTAILRTDTECVSS